MVKESKLFDLAQLSLSPPEKHAFVLVGGGRDLEWYTFDVSHEEEDCQPHLWHLYHSYPFHHAGPHLFHLNDECGEPNLKPKCWASDIGFGWAVLGQNLYRIRRDLGRVAGQDSSVRKKGSQLEFLDLIPNNPMEKGWKTVSCPMPNMVYFGEILVLAGKLYCLGGLPSLEKMSKNKVDEKVEPPWAMAYDPTRNKWESLPNPPHRPFKINYSLFFAATEVPTPCLVVGSCAEGLLQIYHVDGKVWESYDTFDICRVFPVDMVCGPTLAVDGKLYWYGINAQRLGGYDLATRTWFVGSFPMHEHEDYKDADFPGHFPPKLAHLGRGGGKDKFCLFWLSSYAMNYVLGVYNTKGKSRLHCMKFQVVNTGHRCPEVGFIHLEVSILSCQSYIVPGTKTTDFLGALVV